MPQTSTARGRVARSRVSGPEYEPTEWRSRRPSRRRRVRYWKILAAELWNQKQASLAEGEDRDGNPLPPVKKPRKGASDWHGRPYRGGGGPPLSPYRIDSRVRNLLRVRSDTRSAVLYWVPAPLGRRQKTPGGPRVFTELLTIHAHAAVRRDVIGLSAPRVLVATERAIRRYRLKLGPRPMELPATSRAGATGRASRRPEPGREASRRLGRGEGVARAGLRRVASTLFGL